MYGIAGPTDQVKAAADAASSGEIATMLGKGSKQVISNWENDKAEPSLADLRKLADILETTIGYLAGGDEPDAAVTLSKAGYILMSTEEVIAMQRELLELKRRK